MDIIDLFGNAAPHHRRSYSAIAGNPTAARRAAATGSRCDEYAK